jgi:MFS superfamily sulfate permease-like transporter
MPTFSPFYEFFENLFGLFKNAFAFVFQQFFNNGGYNTLGWILLLVPLIMLAIFYFLWKYPYANFWHWLIYIGIIALIVGGITYNSVALKLDNYLVDSDQLIVDFTNTLVLSYSILNACLSLLVSYIFSFILKRKSKIQMHLPH